MLKNFQKFLKTLFKVLYILLKLLFCLFITLFVSYFAILVIFSKPDLQILFYEIISIFTIVGIWIVTFIKVKNRTSIIYVLVFIFWIMLLNTLPSVKKQIDIDDCIDTGTCSEGLSINTEYGKIEINQENCLKYNWIWNEERKYCKLK